MSFKTFLFLGTLFLTFSACTVSKINRKKVVQRHNISIKETNLKPMQVGNGEFAFNVDITGLQTFVPHNTLSHWAFIQCRYLPASIPQISREPFIM
jgi:hypothetical protein